MSYLQKLSVSDLRSILVDLGISPTEAAKVKGKDNLIQAVEKAQQSLENLSLDNVEIT